MNASGLQAFLFDLSITIDRGYYDKIAEFNFPVINYTFTSTSVLPVVRRNVITKLLNFLESLPTFLSSFYMSIIYVLL